jgi:hypothetical protein
MFEQILANARFLAQSEVCIWFVFWAYRRRYELDEKLDRRAKLVRWSIVGVCYVLGCLPGPRFGPAKAVALVVGLAFFCWPNFAYHLTNWFRRRGRPKTARD